MFHPHRRVLALVACLMAFVVVPVSASNIQRSGPSGLSASTKTIKPLAAGIFFSGSFSYSIGSGQVVLKADNVTNPAGTASGPLRFALWWTPTPYPSAGNIVGTYDITPSLAAGQSTGAVNAGGTGTPFTQPPTGCYSVALVLEENVGGTWTERDYGNFSLKFDIGSGCITSFTASPTTVPSGTPSTLSWTTGGGSITSVVIDNGVGTKAANGSTSVSPSTTTTYTLTAFTQANNTPPTKQVTVTVGAAAPTATFSASPTTVTAGQSSTLTWTTTNATSVSIDNGVGSQSTSGTASVSPSGTTTYTLTAMGPGGTTTKTATVTVTQPAPIISSFSASPGTIGSGQSASLIWNTTNATSVTIDHGVGAQAVSGSTSVSPTITTTYTLTATGPGGTTNAQTTVTVTNGPTILFTADPTHIAAGQNATLTWSTTNTTSVTIDNGVGAKPVNGSQIVAPTGTTTYTLTAVGPGGTATAQATVTIVQAPAVLFYADVTTINSGGSATLFWVVGDADFVTIDQGVGNVAANGSVHVSPHQTTTYRLLGSNAAGSTSATVTINVTSPVPPRHRAARH